jgi:hypothetical protein
MRFYAMPKLLQELTLIDWIQHSPTDRFEGIIFVRSIKRGKLI